MLHLHISFEKCRKKVVFTANTGLNQKKQQFVENLAQNNTCLFTSAWIFK